MLLFLVFSLVRVVHKFQVLARCKPNVDQWRMTEPVTDPYVFDKYCVFSLQGLPGDN